ncbi:MAG: hypothetical protein AAFV88_00820 [Planctomycetota bacterium]
MFTPPIRMLLVLVTLAYGAYLLSIGNRSGFLVISAGGLFVFGHFRYGPIRPAFMALQQGEVERAEQLISTIRFPHLLNSQSRAYLNWIHGVLDSRHDDKLKSAEQHLQTALDLGVRTSNDRCVLVATLAAVAIRQNDRDGAKEKLAAAREIPHREGAARYIDQLQRELSSNDEATRGH